MEYHYTIGILAGMGPRSTAPFLESVLDECANQYGAKFDIDFPHIIIYSLPTPFYPKKPLEHHKMVEALQIGIESLSNANCDIISVPCNVVHLYFDQMCKMTEVPILNIMNETMKYLESHTSKVGLLGTQSTIKSGLYQDRLNQRNKTVYWNHSFQHKVDELIDKTKKFGVCDEVLNLWKDIELMMLKNKVSEVVCACTDLYFCGQHSSLKFYDSSKLLAKSLVKKYIEEGLERQNK